MGKVEGREPDVLGEGGQGPEEDEDRGEHERRPALEHGADASAAHRDRPRGRAASASITFRGRQSFRKPTITSSEKTADTMSTRLVS